MRVAKVAFNGNLLFLCVLKASIIYMVLIYLYAGRVCGLSCYMVTLHLEHCVISDDRR